MPLLGAIDQGTSSTRFLVFDSSDGAFIEHHQIQIEQRFPEPGWVEMSPTAIYLSVVECIDKVCEKLEEKGYDPNEIRAIGIANQRETTIAWNKNSGSTYWDAILWLDDRTSVLAEEFVASISTKDKDHYKHITGLPIHPYFSALKMRWILNTVISKNETNEENLINEGFVVGTVDAWLLWNLCRVHYTDVTNASRTNLMDLNTLNWSAEMCSFYNISQRILPQIKSSSEIYGFLQCSRLRGVPISGVLGDQQASLVGHLSLRYGDAKNTYGTGTFMLCNTGNRAIISKRGLLTTVAYQFGADKQAVYALEGSGSIGGNSIKFLRDNLKIIKDASETEDLAKSAKDTEGLYFVPCFTGLFTPYWDVNARGTMIGLTLRTEAAQICRATLEAVAFQTVEMVEAIQSEIGTLQSLKVDGGMTANKFFLGAQANFLGSAILCSNFAEVTGLGAAIAAGLGVSLITIDTALRYQRDASVYTPSISLETRAKELARWKEAVRRSLNWAEPSDRRM